MLEARPYEQRQPKDTIPITDFYTTAEVKEKYHVNESWIFVVAKKNNIPRTFNRGKTYWSKKHIDAYFAKKAPNPDIIEWYSTQEMQEKFGMTLSAIYTFVSKNAIPPQKRRHHGVLFQEACRYSQRSGNTRRTAVLYGSRSDGEIQSHS